MYGIQFIILIASKWPEFTKHMCKGGGAKLSEKTKERL